MNKELREKVNKAVSDNLDYDFMIERIINICADEAIDAISGEKVLLGSIDLISKKEAKLKIAQRMKGTMKMSDF